MTFACDLFRKSQREYWNEIAAECKEAAELDKISCDNFAYFSTLKYRC